MNQPKFNISLKYYGGIYDEKELKRQIEILNKNQIDISTYDQNGIYMNAVESSIISVFVSQAFVQGYLAGLLVNVTWEAFTKFIIWTTKFKTDKDKKLYKTTSKKIEVVEPTFGLNIDVGNNRKIDFRIEGNLTDRQKEICIKKAFQYINNLPPLKQPSIEVAIYNEENDSWNIIDLIDKHRNKM